MRTVTPGILLMPSPVAAPAREGRTRRCVALVAGIAGPLEAGRGLAARTVDAPLLRATGAVCRAFEDTGTIATVTRRTGRGM